MASGAAQVGTARGRARSTAPDTFEKLLSAGAVILLLAVTAALFKGRAEWARVPWAVWPHLLTIAIALALTPVMLLRRRGDRHHRLVGHVWIAAMLLTALSSFFVRSSGGFSIIHILSIWTLIQVPLLWWRARNHDVARHRSGVRGMVTGALLIAGFFTFPFDRMLGHWLLG